MVTSSLAAVALITTLTAPLPDPPRTIAEATDSDFILVYCTLAYGQRGEWNDRLLERRMQQTDYRLLMWSARHMLRFNAEKAENVPLFLARERAICDRSL